MEDNGFAKRKWFNFLEAQASLLPTCVCPPARPFKTPCGQNIMFPAHQHQSYIWNIVLEFMCRGIRNSGLNSINLIRVELAFLPTCLPGGGGMNPLNLNNICDIVQEFMYRGYVIPG